MKSSFFTLLAGSKGRKRASQLSIVFLFFFCLFFSTTSAWAGWVSQESGTTQDLHAIFFPTDAIGYAVGKNGTILRSINGGVTWESKSTGSANYNDVLFFSSKEGYVLGSNGKLLKTTDYGENFTEISISGIPSNAVFKKGSIFGNTHIFAVSTGASSPSYLLASSEGSSTWTLTQLDNFEIDGVYLGPSEGPSYVTWVWGKDSNAGKYVILKNGLVVWSDSNRAVRDVFFVDKDNGYAVGDGGLILKTTGGGDSGEWREITGITSKNLKALWFITSNFGWVVGEEGTVFLTANGGTSWVLYTFDSPVNLNDIFVRSTRIGETVLAYAFIAGNSGGVYKLQSPVIKSIYPVVKSRGWIGTVLITGEGFLEGAEVSFSKPSAGSTSVLSTGGAGGVRIFLAKASASADSQITVLSTSFESSSLLKVRIMIDSAADIGVRDVTVQNLDATLSTEAGAFTVTREVTGKLNISNIWLDGNKYVPPTQESSPARITINSINPRVRFDISSEAELSIDNLTATFLVQVGSDYLFSYIPKTAISTLDAKSVRVDYKIPEKDVTIPFDYRGKEGTAWVYAEDESSGYLDKKTLFVWFATPIDEGTSEAKPPAGAAPGTDAVFLPKQNTWDPEVKPSLPATLVLTPGLSVASFTVRVFDFRGNPVCTKRLGEATAASAYTKKEVVTANGIVTKYDFNINLSELPPYLTSGLYLVMVTDDTTGKLLAKNWLIIAHKSLMSK